MLKITMLVILTILFYSYNTRLKLITKLLYKIILILAYISFILSIKNITILISIKSPKPI